MILASIQSDINLVLALFGGCVGLTLSLIVMAGYLTARQVKKDYRRKGGGRGLARKAGTTMLSALLKRLFLGRWR
ncbi:MAG: hypothetical protein ABGY75_22350 [Gemmataceae bacterium]